jgi:hypothetical protein
MKARRSKSMLLAFLGGYGLMLALYFLHLIGAIYIQGASSWIAQGFIFGFILPAFVYFCLLWIKRDVSVLDISVDVVELRSGLFLNRTLRIPKSSIEKISTNWRGSNSDSPGDLIFVLRDDVSPVSSNSSVLKLKKDGWHFDLSAADITPFEAVRQIKTLLAI